ncbi:MAG: DUF389 domain-containing protein [Ornithinimicrobium sp.]
MPPFAAESLVDQDTVTRTAAQASLSTTYLLYMATSGVLASVALLSNSVPILIGSMIVAPLMAPLALVPLALGMRRRAEAMQGSYVALVGLVVAFVAALLTTALMDIAGVVASDAVLLSHPLLAERVHPGWWSMAAAVAAGLAGTVAQAREKTEVIIGTVAALALVPAVGALAIAVFLGALAPALGALLLLGMNVGLILAMGTIVVLASQGRAGLRPLAIGPVVIIVVLAFLLVWAQDSGTVPETPGNAATSSPAPPENP